MNKPLKFIRLERPWSNSFLTMELPEHIVKSVVEKNRIDNWLNYTFMGWELIHMSPDNPDSDEE